MTARRIPVVAALALVVFLGCGTEDSGEMPLPDPGDQTDQPSDPTDPTDDPAPDPSDPSQPQDEVDLDGDGEPDVSLGDACVDLSAALVCEGETLIGVDSDCDGDIDVSLGPIPESPLCGAVPDSGSSSTCTIIVNGRGAQCEQDGDLYNCECTEDGQVVLVCTDSGNGCDFPGGCCFQ